MKPAKMYLAPALRKGRALILLGTLLAAVITLACSSKSGQAVTSKPVDADLRPAKFQTATPAVTPAAPIAVANQTTVPRQPASKLIGYRSRDYGVSFLYPWQYALVNAKAIATGDASRRPKPDGHEGQFTLARIEIPQGFYPDTDFDSGYFTLSLNQDLSEQECLAALAPGKNDVVGTDTINGVEFRWVESESGGRGSAAKLRNYVAFANDTCYELELGVKTANENGLAREVDPDHVLGRLDVILRTVKILPAGNDAGKEKAAAAAPAPVSQN